MASDRRYEVTHPLPTQITDWRGAFLDPAIRRQVTPGHRVRVQFTVHSDDGWEPVTAALYVTIDEETDGGQLHGVVDDPYVHESDMPFPPGQRVAFARTDIMEIPLQWDGNEALAAAAVPTGDVRPMTGTLDTDTAG